MSVDDPQSAAENAYTFVLVHGGCHDGSLWQPVIERLEQLGHTAYAPTVAGHGKDVPKNVTHAESTQSIVDFIVDQDLTEFVLVGHGYAGTIISKVVEIVPERVRRLVFWSAYVLMTVRVRSKCCRIVLSYSCRWRPIRPTTPS